MLLSPCGKKVSHTCVLAMYDSLYDSLMFVSVLELVACRVKEYEQQIADERVEIATTKEQLSRAQAQEGSLVHQNARMSMELVAAEKREKRLENKVSELEKKLSIEENRFSRIEEEWNSQKTKDKKDQENIQRELSEKSKVLKEYQDKVQYIAKEHTQYVNSCKCSLVSHAVV